MHALCYHGVDLVDTNFSDCMQLSWLGNYSFKIQDKEVSVIIDPHEGMAKAQADIVLQSTADNKQLTTDSIKGEPFVIKTPGEYEVKNVFVYGVPAFRRGEKKQERTTIFLVEIDGITIAHLGDLGQDQLTEAQLETLEGADICIVPVGNGLSAEQAVGIVNQIEPRIVIPMGAKKFDSFIDEIGTKPETMEKLKISKKDLPQEDMKLFILAQEK